MLPRNELYLKAEQCKGILNEYKAIIDAPLVSFFQEKYWQLVQDKGWSEYLLSLSDIELAQVPDPQSFPITADTPESLSELVRSCQNICSYFSGDGSEKQPQEALVKLGMSPKKQHEVSLMSHAVQQQLHKQAISQVIDFGSGKGYLPENIALTTPDIRVLGLDKQEINTKGGLQRNRLMERQWLPLYKKVNPDVSQTIAPPLNHYTPLTLELTPEHISPTFVNTISALSGNCIEPGTDTMLVGLHACGDLTSLLLQIFLASPDLKCIVSVGCCYHIITQKERTACYMTEGIHKEKLSDPSSVHAYPMSKVMQKSPLYFTRNALCLGQQAPEKMAATHALPAKTLFFRAAFQVMLLELCGKPHSLNVGNSASHTSDFVSYSRAALAKLNIELDISDSVVIDYFNKFSAVHERQLYVFYQLRTLLARVIECVILLDRVLYLDEHGVDSTVFSLFDPVVSPRCFVLVATKS